MMKAAADNLIKALSNAQIRIKYIGNSFFYITFANGTRLVTDPYGPAFEQFFGPVPELEAEVVTISHYHMDHTDGISAIKGSPLIIKPEQAGKTYTLGNLKITGFYSEHVADMGINIIYIYEADGFKLVHMGETDQINSPGAIEAVKDADVILAYAGQYGKIKNKDSFRALFDMNIRTVIPQHYSNTPERIFYGEPIIPDILKDIPEGIPIIETREYIASRRQKVQFVYLKTWYE